MPILLPATFNSHHIPFGKIRFSKHERKCQCELKTFSMWETYCSLKNNLVVVDGKRKKLTGWRRTQGDYEKD